MRYTSLNVLEDIAKVKQEKTDEYPIHEPSKEEYRGKRKPKRKKDWNRKDHELDDWN
jgi:hypothetical protein